MKPQAESPVNKDFGAVNDVSRSVYPGSDGEKTVITALPQFGVQSRHRGMDNYYPDLRLCYDMAYLLCRGYAI